MRTLQKEDVHGLPGHMPGTAYALLREKEDRISACQSAPPPNESNVTGSLPLLRGVVMPWQEHR